MGIESLLTRLESGFVTSVTPAAKRSVTEKPAETQGCTLVTPVTPINIVMDNKYVSRGVDARISLTKWDATDWQYFYNERAGILQYEGKLPRPDAERQAFSACISHWLNKNPPAHTDINTCPQCNGAIDMRFNNSIAVLTGNGCHIWLHDKCHTGWLERRKVEASMALVEIGVYRHNAAF